MMWRVLAFSGLLGLIAIACGGSEPAASVGVPEGYELYDGSADGFLIALPSAWVVAEGDVAPFIAEAAEAVLEPGALEILRDSLASEPALFALDATGNPNVNVILQPGPPGPMDAGRWEDLEAILRTQLSELLGATVLSVDRVEYGGTEGLFSVFEVAYPTGLAEQHQYFMVTEDASFVITFTSFDPAADRETFAAVMETFTPVAG